MATLNKAIKDRMRELEHNPASIQRIILETLREVHDEDIEVIDSATPFGFLLQSSAVVTSAAIDEAAALTRKQYAVEAQTEADLYLHMSDKDYLNRFAMPSRAKFTFAFDKEELLQKLVEDPDLNIRKLIIPRNTKVTVNNITFTLQYPIEIRQLLHGGLQIVYNNNIESPIQVLETNIIEYETFTDEGVDWLYFEVELIQVEIKSIFSTTDLVANPEENILLTDNYYYLRAYIYRNGKWEEFQTTHTTQVYDVNKLTAVIKVFNDHVNVSIPQIYVSAGKVDGQLRFDLYQTQGEINADLRVYNSNAYQTVWVPDTFDPASSVYSAPLKNFATLNIGSQDITDGGNRAMTFEELRAAVINNSVGSQDIPITNTQIETALTRSGYDIVRNIDNVTNRSLLATKQLPTPSNKKLVTAASASIETIILNEQEVKDSGSAAVNFRSVTITPNTIFESKAGVMKLVPDAKVKAILSLTPEMRANEVTKNNYYYTPFHYVMDFTQTEFSSRPYYLDTPVALYKSFVSDNDRTLMQVSIAGYEIQRVPTGYRLVLAVSSSRNWKDLSDDKCFVQLAYKPTGERHYAYLNGELQGLNENDERIYHFDIATNWYVDSDHEIHLTKFKMFADEPRTISCPLTQEFDILFATSATMSSDWTPDDVDEKLGKFLLPNEIHCIANERIKLRFGHSLENLWNRCRSVISANDYKRHTTDEVMTYTEDVYALDATTGTPKLTIKDGKVEYGLLHRKGDPVYRTELNDKGELVTTKDVMYKHRVGDVVLDTKGKPVFDNEYALIRQVDLMLVEGAYWFATDAVTTEYRQEIVDNFVNWIVDGVGSLNKRLLEQTRIYFYPKSTVGQIDVMVNNSLRTIIDSGQAFRVDIYVNRAVYSNYDLRNEIKDATIRILSNELKNDVVNNSNMIAALKDAYGSDVIALELNGLGASDSTETVTVLNDAKRLSLRKRLVAQADGTLFVEEDVTCDFISHDRRDLG